MATSAATLIQRTRRFLSDWPENDALTASCTSGAATLTVADATIYSAGHLIQVDDEAIYVKADGTGTTLSVRRAVRGSTGASHASGATVLQRPHFLNVEYLDALNSGISAAFPLLYQPVDDESITTSTSLYEYSLPTINGLAIPYVTRLNFKESGDLAFRLLRDWTIVRGDPGAATINTVAAPFIKLRRYLPVGNLRIQGFTYLPPLTSLTDSLTSLWPVAAEDILTFYASQYLLMSGEAARVREVTGARDDREAANRTGSSMAAAQGLLQRFQMRLMASAMPPLPRTVVATF